MLYQQGDVLIESVAKLPDGVDPVFRPNGGFILAQGSSAGHAHVVEDDILVYEQDGLLYCQAETEFTVKHQEHAPITVPAGRYRIRRVREYDYFVDEYGDPAENFRYLED